jgi:hypothetical protein
VTYAESISAQVGAWKTELSIVFPWRLLSVAFASFQLPQPLLLAVLFPPQLQQLLNAIEAMSACEMQRPFRGVVRLHFHLRTAQLAERTNSPTSDLAPPTQLSVV